MPTVIVRNKDGEFLEEYEITGSFLSWIKESCKKEDVEFTDSIRPPYSATLNGKPWNYPDHDMTLKKDDVINVTIEPKWPAVPYIIAVLAAAYSYYVASNISAGYQNTTESGQSIYTANVNANSISPSGVIREMAGEQHIYPDLICPPHYRYEDGDQFLYLNLCLTRGFADVSGSNLYVAETPVQYYEGDIDYQIKDPGQDISGSDAHENWFQSKEVSDLRLTTAAGLVGGDWSIDASGDLMTSYLGGIATAFPFDVDEDFEIVSGGNNPGIYRVIAISGASNEIAQLQELQYTGGTTGRLEVLTRIQDRNVRRNIFDVTGAASLTPATGVAITEWQGLNGGVNWEGPYLAIPPNEAARYGEFDIKFPQGLVQLDGSNNQIDKFVRLVIRWRDRGTSSWTNEIVDTTSNTYDEVAKTVTIDYGSEITPEVMFRRVTKDSDEITINDVVDIERVKHKLTSPTSYPDVTTIQMRLRGTNALAQTAENRINVRNASRKLPTLQEIEDAANGIPFDLGGDKNIDTSWNIQYENFVSSYDLDGIDPVVSSTNLQGMDISSDGQNLIVNNTSRIMSFSMASSPYNFRDAQYTGYFQVNGFISHSVVRTADNGGKMAVLGRVSSPFGWTFINMYTLSSPYNPSTASLDGVYNISTVNNDSSIFINNAGGQYWFGQEDVIRELSMTGFDVTTSLFTGDELDVSSDVSPSQMRSFYIGDSFSKIYVLTLAGDIFSYTMSTPGDITTASLDSPGSNNFDVGFQYVDLVVQQNHVFTCNSLSFVSQWDIPSTINIRRSRSLVRFVANAIYDAIGEDVLEQLNFDDLDDLDTLLEGRQDYLDAEFIDETTLWEAIKIMAAPGYSEPVIKEGVFDLVRTAAGTNFTNLYTPDVMLGDGLQIDQKFYGSQEPDGVDVEYFSLETYANEVYEYRLPGDLGLRPKRIQAIGIGTEEKAYRIAARERRRDRAKPNTYTFTTELDALNSNYGDPIAIASDVFGGQYGHVVGVSGSVIALDFDPNPISGSATATFRNPEGTMSSTHSITLGPNSNEITLISPSVPDFTLITDENEEPNLVTIGDTDDYVRRAIVRRISPQNDNEVSVTAEEYVSDIYADDDNSPS